MNAQLKPIETPRVFYIVETKDGAFPRLFVSNEHARAWATCQDHEYKTMAPHRIVVVRELFA